MTQELLRTLHCLSFGEFNKIMNGLGEVSEPRKAYTEQKWEDFRANLASFLMELDSEYFETFVQYAEYKILSRRKHLTDISQFKT